MAGENRRYYRAKAKEWDLGKAETGTDQVAVVFEYVDGDQKGKRITWYGFLTDKTIDRTVEALKLLSDVEVPDLADLKGLDRNEVELVVEEDTYNDKTRDRVVFVNRAGGLALKNRLDVGEKAALAERLRGRVALAAQKLAGSGAGSVPGLSGKADDDIPF
jgi:hypothetical protein